MQPENKNMLTTLHWAFFTDTICSFQTKIQEEYIHSRVL